MYIVVIGGGKVGYYLTKALLEERHEVLLVERDFKRAARIGEDFGQGVVLRGDGAETATLELAAWAGRRRLRRDGRRRGQPRGMPGGEAPFQRHPHDRPYQ